MDPHPTFMQDLYILRAGLKHSSSQERALEENEESTKFRTAQGHKAGTLNTALGQ